MQLSNIKEKLLCHKSCQTTQNTTLKRSDNSDSRFFPMLFYLRCVTKLPQKQEPEINAVFQSL